MSSFSELNGRLNNSVAVFRWKTGAKQLYFGEAPAVCQDSSANAPISFRFRDKWIEYYFAKLGLIINLLSIFNTTHDLQ